MGIKFYGSNISTPASQIKALRKLRGFLDANEPELVYFLHRLWQNQQKALTYKELREAIINEGLDPQLVLDWQQDYSNFVIDYMRPAWETAMLEATSELSTKYQDFVLDFSELGIKKWIDFKAASFVTNSTDEQIKAINSVVGRAAMMKDMTVDGLARAIRPMVGLTKQQAQANLNYYQKMIESGLSEKQALERSIKYSAKQHRYRGYNIARTELAFAYNKGQHAGVEQAIEQGYMGPMIKRWCTAEDERVCSICGGLENATAEMAEDFKFNTKLEYNNPGIKQTPPAHPSCRCSVLYEEVAPPAYDTIHEMTEEEIEEPEEIQIPGEADLPSEDELRYKGPSHMGGTGESYIYSDQNGQKYLFKVATDKGTSHVAPFRAYAQEAGYKVQSIIDPDTAVPVKTMTIGGRLGTLQPILDAEDNNHLQAWMYGAENIDKATINQLQREHVTDWLLGNFDANPGNFIRTKSGKLIGIDKEQSFKYLYDTKSQAMSYTYHPNSMYGATQPVYNELFSKYAGNYLDMNLNDFLPYIKRIESISDKEYRAIFQKYAEELTKTKKEAEELLDRIVERKQNLRVTYRVFFEELLQQRTGKKVSFKFLDEGAKQAKQTISAILMTEEEASKLTIAELKKIAKSNNVPNFGNMSKQQLITCITEPERIEEMSNQVKAKLKAAALRRKQSGQNLPSSEKKPNMDGIWNAEDVFSDFDTIPERVNGISVRSDFDAIEGQQINVRKIVLDDKPYIEVTGKLTNIAWEDAIDTMKRRPDISKATMGYARGSISDNKLFVNSGNKLAIGTIDGYAYNKKGCTFVLADHDIVTTRNGEFIVYIPDKVGANYDAEALLQKLKLDFMTKNPTKEAELTMKKARLLWQHAPSQAKLYSESKNKLEDIDYYLKKAGIDPKRVDDLELVEVFDGYSTYVDKKIYKEYKAAGLEYVWTGVQNTRSVVATYKGGGLASTRRRCLNGFIGNGASTSSDMISGGADSVFTRMAPRNPKKWREPVKYAYSYGSGSYQIIIDPKITARTDWHAYHWDKFGATHGRDFEDRDSTLNFIKKEKKEYRDGNEMMFRTGISSKDWIAIDTGTEFEKDELIAAFLKEGITEINGIPLKQFIRVNPYVGVPIK